MARRPQGGRQRRPAPDNERHVEDEEDGDAPLQIVASIR